MKFPATLGECADKLYNDRETRLALESEAEAMKKKEGELKFHIRKLLIAGKQKGVRGMVANVTLSPKTIATINEDTGGWAALQQYIKENDAFDLLHRRINDKAYLDRLAAKVVVPGLKPENVLNLSVTKAGRKGVEQHGQEEAGGRGSRGKRSAGGVRGTRHR